MIHPQNRKGFKTRVSIIDYQVSGLNTRMGHHKEKYKNNQDEIDLIAFEEDSDSEMQLGVSSSDS